MDSPGGPFFTSDSSVGRAGDCSNHYFAALPILANLPKSLVRFRLRRIFPFWDPNLVGLIAQLVRALGCYYVVFRGRPWICVVVVTYPTHMFAAYTGKSWVQPPVGPPFFISFYDLKNDFLSSVVIFSENITGGADELYLRAMTLVTPKFPVPPLRHTWLAPCS